MASTTKDNLKSNEVNQRKCALVTGITGQV